MSGQTEDVVPRTDRQAERQAAVSALVRDFLVANTDVTRPSFNATRISHALIPLLDRFSAEDVAAARADAWDEAASFAVGWPADLAHALMGHNPYRSEPDNTPASPTQGGDT